ncbi:MAG: UDP-glucose/GDP-mannose dehydrogenase family protein [Candidatus Nanohaloarchaea archaeon]
MDISVIGTGYVGLSVSAALASQGHEVTCVDRDREKVGQVRAGECPVHEEDLEKLVSETVSSGKLDATMDTAEAVRNSEVTFLSVGTPTEGGEIDTSQIQEAAEEAAEGLEDDYHLFVVKSTVIPGTTRDEVIPAIESVSGKTVGDDFGVCMNPEFLRQGSALEDFQDPDRVVIGEYDKRSGDELASVYDGIDDPVVRASLEEAEMIKYASNSLLATKISFINEIGNLCKELGIDVYRVADCVGMDERLERDFLDSGVGFGGSCFPKDVRALVFFMDEKGTEPELLKSVLSVNQDQRRRIIELLEDRIGPLDGKKVAVLGLSFKPGTDDVRNAPAIDIIQELKDSGVEVAAYDPEAMENMKQHHPGIDYTESYQEALEDADGALLLTEWPEFDGISRGDLKLMENPVLLEGRKTDHDLPEELREGITWP